MKISVVGCGYVGLVTATCLADSGNNVLAVDKDAERVRLLSAGRVPIYEPGLEDLLVANLNAGRIRFSTRLEEAADDVEVVILAVGTPPRPDGSADLSQLETASLHLARQLQRGTVLVIKSTVPPGSAEQLEQQVASLTHHRCPVVSNPEFLKEGDAVSDFLRPDRVVIGAEDDSAGDLVADLYEPFVRNGKPILRMSRRSAELTKYAANAYLAMRISFINEIADICDRWQIDVNEVRRGIGSDARIGLHFLYPGLGYGGSCFPKDVQALVAGARAAGGRADLLAAVHERNLAQRTQMLGRIVERFSGNLRGRRIAVWGLAFKPKTDDIRDAPAIQLVEELTAAGASIAAYDPRALPAAQQHFGSRIECGAEAYSILKQADALLICTEWNEFRTPDFRRIRSLLRQPLIFDGRNLYERRTLMRYGFEYHSVGRPAVYPPAHPGPVQAMA